MLLCDCVYPQTNECLFECMLYKLSSAYCVYTFSFVVRGHVSKVQYAFDSYNLKG